MSDVVQQYERIRRALTHIKNNKNRNLVDYEDDVWSFFQNCWHLKDWVKNDEAISEVYRKKVESDVNNIQELKVCADLANRSKHLKLTSSRVDAQVTKRNLHIYAGPPGEGFGEYNFIIQLDNGNSYDAIQLAENAVKKWENLLTSYGVL